MRKATRETSARLRVDYWKVEQTLWRERDIWDTLCSKGHAEREFRSIPDCWSSKARTRQTLQWVPGIPANARPAKKAVHKAQLLEARPAVERPLKALDLARVPKSTS